MKILKRLGGALLALIVVFALAAPALASEAKDGYTYTVRILAGGQGSIDGEEVVTYTGLHYGERVTFDINRVILFDDSKYYVRGIRESGKDNDTVAAPSILVTEDVDYVVAYGIPGSTVAYTVNYQDTNGDTLYPSATYYGNVGDRPVVAFQYVEGYQPQAYNLTKTLSENAADNVFTFVYTSAEAGGFPPVVVGPEGGGNGDNPGGGPGVDIPEGNTPQGQGPDDLQNLDEPDTPMGPGSFVPKIIADAAALPLGTKITILGGGVILLGFLAWLLIFRKKNKEQDGDG